MLRAAPCPCLRLRPRRRSIPRRPRGLLRIRTGWCIREDRRESVRSDAEALAGAAPVKAEDVATHPGRLAGQWWLVDPAWRLPAHEMQVEEFARAVALVGEAAVPPEPSLRVVQAPVVPAARAQHGRMAFDEQAALGHRGEQGLAERAFVDGGIMRQL